MREQQHTINAAAELGAWIAALNRALDAGSADDVAALFHDDSYWRDLVALTWNITTVARRPGIRDLVAEAIDHTRPQRFAISTIWSEVDVIDGVVSGWLEFETESGRGRGHVRLRGGRAWTMLTALWELKGFEETVRDRRPLGAEHGARQDRMTWSERRANEYAAMGTDVQPYALIVGAGQGGLAVAARLKQLGVPTLVIDRLPKPGDSWRRRYATLCLHDVVWYDHLPYLDFPVTWPIYTPKDKMADWLCAYAELLDLDVWCSTSCERAEWDAIGNRWSVTVLRDGVEHTLHPAHLVLATGVAGEPVVPPLAGQEIFTGDQHHSSEHPGPIPFQDKRVVVVGANNSAHDISAALWEVGADVTMIQRSSALVVRVDTMRELSQAPLYSEQALRRGITTDRADLTLASIPAALMPAFQRPRWDAIRDHDREFYSALTGSGFKLDFGEDDSGLWMKYLSRGGGYYIDVGASQLIIDGSVGLRSGQAIRELTEDAVVLESGERIAADVVVYATGYGNMNDVVRTLLGDDIADRVGQVWGIGSERYADPGPWEGELRNMWKPTAQRGLWIHGGNLALSRHYSRYLALQIKARFEQIITDH